MTITSHRASGTQEGGLRGVHVLGALVAFFGVVFVVNGYFLFSALSTHTGVVSAEPYRKGLAYNARIAADERQSALGWKDQLDVGRDGRVRLALRTAEGTPVEGLQVSANLGRPATQRHDLMLRLAETAPGDYTAEAGALDEGNWVVSIEAFRAAADAEPTLRLRRRLWLKR